MSIVNWKFLRNVHCTGPLADHSGFLRSLFPLLYLRTHTASKDNFSMTPVSLFGCEAVSLGDLNAMILVTTQHAVYTGAQPVLFPVPSPFVIYLGSSRRLEKRKKSED